MNSAAQQAPDVAFEVTWSIRNIVPDAEVILYGSRARGDFSRDSDWDFLVLCDGGENREVKAAISDAVYELQFVIGPQLEQWPSISVLTHSREYWSRKLIQATPYHREVTRDGVKL